MEPHPSLHRLDRRITRLEAKWETAVELAGVQASGMRKIKGKIEERSVW